MSSSVLPKTSAREVVFLLPTESWDGVPKDARMTDFGREGFKARITLSQDLRWSLDTGRWDGGLG